MLLSELSNGLALWLLLSLLISLRVYTSLALFLILSLPSTLFCSALCNFSHLLPSLSLSIFFSNLSILPSLILTAFHLSFLPLPSPPPPALPPPSATPACVSSAREKPARPQGRPRHRRKVHFAPSLWTRQLAPVGGVSSNQLPKGLGRRLHPGIISMQELLENSSRGFLFVGDVGSP